tara:strand:+ start:460 stop:993 length:534 start_codon:yes stop_codon:yes gene_type:complete
MLIMGICNPKGEGVDYNGLYLTQNELHNLVSYNQLLNVPVKTEHCGDNIGHIVSAYINPNHQLQCVMEIDNKKSTGAVVGGFIRDGLALELSLGYVVDVTHSKVPNEEKLRAGDKRVLEVSVVKKGAREGCYIMAYEDRGATFYKQDTHSCNDNHRDKTQPHSEWQDFCSNTPFNSR